MKTKLTSILLCAFVCSSLSCSQIATEKERDVSPRVNVTRPEEAFPFQRGLPETGTLHGDKITYSLVGGQAVFQSDILIKPDSISTTADLHTEGTGRSKVSTRWPNKIVYYAVDPALPNQARVTDAIAH